MRHQRSKRREALIRTAIAALLLLATAPALLAEEPDFDAELARIDDALRKNPGRVLPAALDSCRSRRNSAVRLYESGQPARARRRLKSCRNLLGLSDVVAADEPGAATPSMGEIQAQAARELESALDLEPNLAHGLEIYRECAACHMPEGWGLHNGTVPQLAGQHRKVVIKQLVDIRAGHRDNPLMVPYSSVESIGGTQSVADVAGYIDTLEISADTGKGPGEDLELGERIYRENCTRCHGATGAGDNDAFVPRIQAQHYNYLVRQFEWIRDGKRRNANPEMVAQIRGFGDRETHAVLDYVSRLEPPEELRAPPGWHNPDFSH